MKHIKYFRLLIAIMTMIVTFASGCIFSLPQIDLENRRQDNSSDTSIPAPINPNWTPPPVNSKVLNLPSFADVIERAYPSVVSINTETVTLDIFSQQQLQKGAGSGWILDNRSKSVYIVTNNHVVEGAKKVTVETYDGRTFEADTTSVKRDPVSDLAVIEIKNTTLQAIGLGDSTKLRVGDWVLALGNPLGRGLKAKEGTISGLKVSLPIEQGQTLSDLIETSAPINPGNSGGPLINLSGEVVGITSAKIADVGVEGLGYAISIKTALPIINELITRGYIIRPFMGVSTITVNPLLARRYNLSVTKGALIADNPSGPALREGLKIMDIIIKYNSKDISNSEDLVQSIYSSKVGEEIEITFVRGQETKVIKITLENRPPSR